MDETPGTGEAMEARREEPSRDRRDQSRLALVTAIILLGAAVLTFVSAILPLLH